VGIEPDRYGDPLEIVVISFMESLIELLQVDLLATVAVEGIVEAVTG
jgi:hypothetical protein